MPNKALHEYNTHAYGAGMSYGNYVAIKEPLESSKVSKIIKDKKSKKEYHKKTIDQWAKIREIAKEIGEIVTQKEDMLCALRAGCRILGCSEVNGELQIEYAYELQKTSNSKRNILFIYEGCGHFEMECMYAFCLNAYAEHKWIQTFYKMHDIVIKDSKQKFNVKSKLKTIDTYQLAILNKFKENVSN